MKYGLTAAVIGSGYMGEQYLEILSGLVERVILCSNDEAKGRALSQKYRCDFYMDYEELYKGETPDFVCICLPTNLHCDATVKALESGFHVLCEKPFASSVEEAELMLSVARKKGKTLMIGQVARFSKAYEYLKRCISDRRFGELLYMELYRHSDTPLWSVGGWLQDVSRSGGVLRDLHIHDTDALVGLLGLPEGVYTVGGDTVCRSVYTYGAGKSVSASASWRNAKDFPFYMGYDVVFENATLQRQGDDVILYKSGTAENPLENENFSEFFKNDDSLYNELNYFCYVIENGIIPELCPPEETLKTMLLNHSEAVSLKSGKEVKIC